MRFAELVEIPRQCRDCPMLGRIASGYNHLEDEKIELLDFTTVNRDVAIAEIALQDDVALEEAEEFYELHQAELRQILLHDHDKIVDMQEAEIGLSHKMLLLCQDGVMRMRAVRKGTQVEVALCMSDATRMTSSVVGFEVAKVRRKQLPPTTENKITPPSE